MINKEQFQEAVVKSGKKETSMSPDHWNEENPTLGHCAVVALTAQDIYGGKLLKASLEGTGFAYGRSHYWNLLPDGSEIDFTEAQFEGRKPQLNGEVRTREYVLSNELTKQRYELLKVIILIELSKVLDACSS
ncbi:MAG: hypothetical protein UV28_C0013G0019 [Candidatus Collierbacteria bacterium GW2011_GWE2_42_48]|uniref:YunG n=1 Tax=Candidatus Collierbacteria bacterium GW2011_GWA2_42_17 TaxID=1618378 RepID=A0A0G0Z246_9BACT|nr:MAG: hypothetical protein UV06_C0005G0031 [Candidatus Collierbacteria bacterium GW2011_GWA2_42_17]KKS62284.1 MAG: hypothetical protein UV28_C0013G0019 [Candidatus Collierbacteria bacterium GW2011_GWE2_42_48]HAI22195.1 hypothetical protein [Candidatus Collierbacteria bacterium]